MRKHVMDLAVACTVGLFLLASAGDLFGADSEEPLVKRLTTLRKAGRPADIADLLEQVPQTYKSSASAMQTKLRTELGKILKDPDMSKARRTTIQALLDLDDPVNAWKVLSKSMPSPKLETASALDTAVVSAAGRLSQPKAIKPLLELAGKAADPGLAAAAARALGAFGQDTKNRTKVLTELVSLGKRVKPSSSPGGKGASDAAKKRWEALEPALVSGLNELTQRNVTTFDEWVALWAENKKRLRALFPEAE